MIASGRVTPARSPSDFPHYQTACNHIVQRLLLCRKSRHEVSNPQWDQPGDEFCEESSAGSSERNRTQLHVGDDDAERDLA